MFNAGAFPGSPYKDITPMKKVGAILIIVEHVIRFLGYKNESIKTTILPLPLFLPLPRPRPE